MYWLWLELGQVLVFYAVLLNELKVTIALRLYAYTAVWRFAYNNLRYKLPYLRELFAEESTVVYTIGTGQAHWRPTLNTLYLFS